MRRLTATITVASFVLAGELLYAGPIIESAMRLAVTPAQREGQPTDCQAAARNGEDDGRARQGSGGWFAGGLLLSPFFVPIMPIVAHTSDPTPPVDALSGIARDDLDCYTTGYVRAAKGRRVRASWIGYGVSIGLWTAVVAAAISTDRY